MEAAESEPTGSSSIPGSLRLGRGAAMWLMKASRSKRCRPARPLPGVGRLAERERPAGLRGSSMQDQVALGAQRAPTPGKGGIARAAGSQERGDGLAAPGTCGGGKRSGWETCTTTREATSSTFTLLLPFRVLTLDIEGLFGVDIA